MTNQEKIREGLAEIVKEVTGCDDWKAREVAVAASLKLHSQGVVIKIDSELPLPEYWAGEWYSDDNGNKVSLEDAIRRAGYVATVPLVEV